MPATVTVTSTEVFNSTTTTTIKHGGTQTVVVIKIHLVGGASISMANLDMSVIFITLVISLIITLLGYAMKEWLFQLFSIIYGMMVMTYLNTNYNLVSLGTGSNQFTISFWPVFTLMYLFICMVMPGILLWREVS